MSERDSNRGVPKRSAFDLTTVSLGLALGGLFMGGLIGEIVTIGPAAGVGLAFGLLGLYQTKRAGRKLYKPIAAATVNCLLLILALGLGGGNSRRYELALRVVCGTNLKGLGSAMLVYAGEFDDRYPTADKWCDLLVEQAKVTPKQLVCKGALARGDKGSCHYAMNPDCEPNSPNDVVLLFDTKGGWNQYGGPEILTTENHKDKGCNILFNDGYVRFVPSDELSLLKWKAEQAGQ
jgi:hypothetical protein